MTGPAETLWPLEPHTKGKHLVLRHYLDAWLPILGLWSGRILFIDGFAGPGEYTGGERGSPLIALDAFTNHRFREKLRGEVIFLFIEKVEARAAHLRSLVDPLRPSLPANCKVYIETGQFDETMTAALDSVEATGGGLAPAFVMVDPFGISGTPMSVLRRILGNDRSEVYVSFMYEWINRFKETGEFPPHLDSLFGTERWRDALGINDPGERRRFLFSVYEQQLREAGAMQIVRFDLYEANRIKYAIFFGTHSTTGSNRMKEAIWKVAPFGDFAFRGSRSSQLGLDLQAADFDPLKQALRNEFGGGEWVVVEAVLEFGLDPVSWTPGW